ncbi:hypothetical protein [Acetobacter okinawensis]|uniref:hypothetical protein n=1 Tax=Acetobacter okinawensis TaxID=1076594 RepID=UPI00117742D9|nr:hypothetical protein [Acetobacter okinawensis]
MNKKLETLIISVVLAVSLIGGRIYVDDYMHNLKDMTGNKTEFVSDIYPWCSSSDKFKISACMYYVRGVMQSANVIESIFKTVPLGCNLNAVTVKDIILDLNKWADDNKGEARETSAAGEILVLAKNRAVCPSE